MTVATGESPARCCPLCGRDESSVVAPVLVRDLVAGYRHAGVRRRLAALLGFSESILDSSLSARLLSKVAARIGRFYAKGLNDPRLLPSGHSVTAVYRKR